MLRDRSLWAELLRLAIPMAAATAGNNIMSLMDAVVVGRFDATLLSALGIGSTLYFAISTVALGTVFALDPLLSQAAGAGETHRLRPLLVRGLELAVIMALGFGVLGLGLAELLGLLALPEATRAIAQDVLRLRLIGMVPFLLFIALRCFLQVRLQTRPILVATGIGIAMNLVLNLLLVFGDPGLLSVGLPAIGLAAGGAQGSALASAIATWTMLPVLWWVVKPGTGLDRTELARLNRRKQFATMLRIGLPTGMQIFLEVSAFSLGTLLAGYLGDSSGAAHQITLQLASFTFTIVLGVAIATGTMVGRAIGAGEPDRARQSGYVGMLLGVAIMSVSSVLFAVFPSPAARLVTQDEPVIALAIPLLRIAALFQLSDALQVIASSALRGAGDTKVSQIANFVGHYLLGLPVGIGLAFGAGWGVLGIWVGFLVGLTAVALWLTLRFRTIAMRRIE